MKLSQQQIRFRVYINWTFAVANAVLAFATSSLIWAALHSIVAIFCWLCAMSLQNHLEKE